MRRLFAGRGGGGEGRVREGGVGAAKRKKKKKKKKKKKRNASLAAQEENNPSDDIENSRLAFDFIFSVLVLAQTLVHLERREGGSEGDETKEVMQGVFFFARGGREEEEEERMLPSVKTVESCGNSELSGTSIV